MSRNLGIPGLLVVLSTVAVTSATAQSFRVQCPASTITHPTATNNNSEPDYTGPSYTGTAGYPASATNVNGAIKCQQISGGDGYATMGDGTQTYMFNFGPLSGLVDIANGQPGTEFPSVFNGLYSGAHPLQPGDPATTVDNNAGAFTFNGAVGLAPDIANLVSIYDIAESTASGSHLVVVQANAPLGVQPGDTVVIAGTQTGYDGSFTVTGTGFPASAPGVTNYGFPTNFTFTYNATATGLADVNTSQTATAATPPVIDGHVDPRQIMDVGVMNGNIPAPLMAIDEDDEFFLTLTNVGMIMRPDLFEQHTVHFHGYPNASSFYDGVPDASVAINIGGSFTYYYLAPDAGTYFWHCHITPPEHLQMGMVGQIYVRPRQNRVPSGGDLYAALQTQQLDLRTACNSAADILCSNPLPGGEYRLQTGHGSSDWPALQVRLQRRRRLDPIRRRVSHPDPRLRPQLPLCRHDFQPGRLRGHEGQVLPAERAQLPRHGHIPGRSQTQSADGVNHFSQPLPSIINIPAGGRALLRISDLDVQEYQTLASLGIPMKVIAHQRQAAAGSGGQQHVLQHQLDHAGWRRVAGRDSGCQRHDAVSDAAACSISTPPISTTCPTTPRTSAG